jgi:hypothetical protein
VATYQLVAVPKAGRNPSPSARPLAPRDLAANSDNEAMEYATPFIDQQIGELCEALRVTHGEEAANEFEAMAAQWQPQVRRVNRPIVDVNRRSWTTDGIRNGVVVGQHIHYATETGEQAFDVLVGGEVTGLLTEGRRIAAGERNRLVRVWHLREARGVLTPLAGRRWDDGRDIGPDDILDFVYPEVAVAAIRAALERP